MVLIYVLLAYGITNIIVYGNIFDGLRSFVSKSKFLGKLFSCPMCCSTWVGFILSTIFILTANLTPIGLFFTLPTLLTIFLDGCFTSGAVWLIFVIEEALTEEEQ